MGENQHMQLLRFPLPTKRRRRRKDVLVTARIICFQSRSFFFFFKRKSFYKRKKERKKERKKMQQEDNSVYFTIYPLPYPSCFLPTEKLFDWRDHVFNAVSEISRAVSSRVVATRDEGSCEARELTLFVFFTFYFICVLFVCFCFWFVLTLVGWLVGWLVSSVIIIIIVIYSHHLRDWWSHVTSSCKAWGGFFGFLFVCLLVYP